MRIVMMGTGPFAVPTFQWLLDSNHAVVALITRPARSTGARRPPPNPMREVAEPTGIEIHSPDNINDGASLSLLAGYAADLYVVCDYGQILSADALATSRLGGINLHASLLPRYRGAAPIHWALYHGESVTGVTVIHMTTRLDAGPCLVQQSTPIGPDEDAEQLELRLAKMGPQAVSRAIDMLAAWDGQSPLGVVQDMALATRAPRLKKNDGRVDWRRSADQIAHQVRAFHPWPGSYTLWLRDAAPLRIVLRRVHADSESIPDRPPGTVARVDAQHAWVACGEGTLRLDAVQPSGKTVIAIAEFLRGYPMRPDDRLGDADESTPRQNAEN
jgi:methionyl-tRNA formyltransferase